MRPMPYWKVSGHDNICNLTIFMGVIYGINPIYILQVFISCTLSIYRLPQTTLLKHFKRDLPTYQGIPPEYNSLRKCYWTQINFRNLLCSFNGHHLLSFELYFCDFHDKHIQTVMKCPYEKALKCIYRISMSSM